MKRIRFSEEQMIGILKARAGMPVADLCRKHGVSNAKLKKLWPIPCCNSDCQVCGLPESLKRSWRT